MCARRWSEERVQMLQFLWAGGATGEAIAEQLGGVSRSAVLGKIFRLRAAARRGAAGTATEPLEHSRGRRRKRGKTLLELTNQTCRWPYGEPGRPGFHFCGEPGADLERGMPYCARHAQLASGGGAVSAESNKPDSAAVDADPPPQPADERRRIVPAFARTAVPGRK